MGFAALGNAGLDVWKANPRLPAVAFKPDFGKDLDAAMEVLFSWCVKMDVPIMAHTNRSNAPCAAFRELAGAEYWEQALRKYPELRVNFGHFGDTDLEDHAGTAPKGFVALMSKGAGKPGQYAFADSAYFAGVLKNRNAVVTVLKDLYAGSTDRLLTERLMYGTDWTMILPQKNVDNYLAEFIEVIDKVQGATPGAPATGSASLANAFFGGNAAQFLGLGKGAKARQRLQNFYDRRKISEPDWMRKVA